MSDRVAPEELLAHQDRLLAQGINIRALLHRSSPLEGEGEASSEGVKRGLEAFAAPKTWWRMAHSFVDVVLDPAADGQPLTIEFRPAPGGDAQFNVQLWKLIDLEGGARPRRVPTQTTAPEVLTGKNADRHLSYVIPRVDTTTYDRLALIITRLDSDETSDPAGNYTITLSPTTEAEDSTPG